MTIEEVPDGSVTFNTPSDIVAGAGFPLTVTVGSEDHDPKSLSSTPPLVVTVPPTVIALLIDIRARSSLTALTPVNVASKAFDNNGTAAIGSSSHRKPVMSNGPV